MGGNEEEDGRGRSGREDMTGPLSRALVPLSLLWGRSQRSAKHPCHLGGCGVNPVPPHSTEQTYPKPGASALPQISTLISCLPGHLLEESKGHRVGTGRLGAEAVPRRGKRCSLPSHPPLLASRPSGRQTPSHPPGHPKGTVPPSQPAHGCYVARCCPNWSVC